MLSSVGRDAEKGRELLYKTLAGAGAAQRLRALERDGVLISVIPELASLRGVGQPREHFWDVFDHSVETVAAVEQVLELAMPSGRDRGALAIPALFNLGGHLQRQIEAPWDRRTLLKLAALLHDVAKPATKSIQADGRIRFFHHARQGAAMAETIMTRLGFTWSATYLVCTLVRYHLRPGQLGWDPYPTPRALLRFFRDVGEAVPDLLILNLADHLAMRGPLLEPDDWEGHLRAVGYILGQYAQSLEERTAVALVNGHDLMAALGISPGPQVGALLRAIQAAHSAGEISTREEALEMAARLLHRGDISSEESARETEVLE